MVGRWVLGVAVLAALTCGLAAMRHGGPEAITLPPGTWGVVRRVEVAPTVLVPGDVFSRERTTIKVEVENMRPPTASMSGRRRWMPTPASTILWIVPNGAQVEKGDLLARLDASWFDDEARFQEVETQRAAAELARAELTLEIARAELRTFDEGERLRQEAQNRTALALAQTTQSRTRDRGEWVTRMFGLGYAANAELAQTEADAVRADVEVQRADTLREVYQLYTAPRIQRWWEIQIEQAQAEVTFAREQDQLEQNRLKQLRTQIERCTITAPHDGEVVYAEDWYEEDIAPGMDVYQGFALLYLPQRGQMAVQAVVSEDQAMRVKAGQEAVVHIGAFPDRTFAGKVEVLEAQPVPNWKRWDDAPIFYSTIAVEDPDHLLFNEMSASVEIRTAPAASKLVVPSEAVLIEGGAEFCDVLVDSAWVRRAVDTAPASWDLLEVRSGLEEGDRVRLRPWDADGRPAATATANGG